MIACLVISLWLPAAPAQHWSFRPPLAAKAPCVQRQDLLENAIDAHIEYVLEAKGLALGVEARPETLIRRLCFDLTGLPPTPREVAAFVADDSPAAYERLVDRLLASPRLGERWGRHWLDAAGYADSNGYFSADSERPLAYKYRDWVIRAHNADKPFDRFVAEQIAGDELAGYEADGDVTLEAAELLVATHFLRNSQDGTGESDGNPVEVLIDKVSVIDGAVQILGSSLLGMTLQCARCHDHKFDPLSHAEYYALHAVLAPAYATRAWRKPVERVVRVGTRAERQAHDSAVAIADGEIAAWKESLDGAVEPLRRLASLEKAVALEAGERTAVEKALGTGKGKRSEEQNALLKKHEKLLETSDEELDKRFVGLDAMRSSVRAAIERIEHSKPPPLEKLSVLHDVDLDPPAQRILLRGSATDPGPEVLPDVPSALAVAGESFVVRPTGSPTKSTGRRLALARWLTSSGNPVVARVLVNRVWQHHFGVGLVATPDNFGTTGAPPTHPELLDSLAREFIESGWSLKTLHRRIVTSAAYRQTSRPRAEGLAVDQENRLLWRFAPRRLEAECVRDAQLYVAGELDLRMGGAPVPVEQADDGQFVVREGKPGALRRSVYLEHRRTKPVTLLEVFDSPLIVASCTRRSSSTTALQSLALLNSKFALARAEAFATRLVRESEATSPESVVDLAFQLTLGRSPSADEYRAALTFLAESSPAAQRSGPEAQDATRREFAQALLACNAFLYLE